MLIKRRGKMGLIGTCKDIRSVHQWIAEKSQHPLKIGGVSGTLDRFIIEPFIPHENNEEYYVCIFTESDNNTILFHHQGGVDVGNVDDKASRYLVSIDEMLGPAGTSCLTPDQLLKSNLLSSIGDEARKSILADFIADLHRLFVELHFAFLELNPIVLCKWPATDRLGVHVLDAAGKVDQCAEYLLANNRWLVQGHHQLTFPAPFGQSQSEEEAYINRLDAQSGASLKLTLLNPLQGRVWLMVAGGGASVIYADTVCELAQQVKTEQSRGQGARDLANYGEYSGAPSEAQMVEYASTVLSLMTRSEPNPDGKILLIGGGIANFTNVADTFKGIVSALRKYVNQLKEHKVSVYVRRGGPNYQAGLQLMRQVGEL